MSAITEALEREVAAIRALPAEKDSRTAQKHDRQFARIMALVAPRTRHFTRVYGLLDMADDAQQACAIGVHRAICDYDPDRAKFTTFVNWQLRCELQALRYRMRLDSRDSARKVGARTVSLEAHAGIGSETSPFELPDELATDRVEAACASRLAHDAFDALIGEYEEGRRRRAGGETSRPALYRRAVKPCKLHPAHIAALEEELARERAIVTRYVFADGDDMKFDPDLPLDNEKQRQISRRVLRNLCAQIDASAFI